MFDVGWQELGLIAVVALVVLGPEELPVIMRKAGRFMRKARLVVHDFRMNLEEMADEAELRDIEREAYKKAVAIEPATVSAVEPPLISTEETNNDERPRPPTA